MVVTLGTAVLASGCGGSDGAGGGTARRAATATSVAALPVSDALALTVRSPKGLVVLGRTAQLRATLPAGVARVELWSYPLGHEREARREAVRERPAAHLTFTVRPERSRAYELRAGGRSSEAALVGVALRSRLGISAVGRRGVRVDLDLAGPEDLRPNVMAKVYLYYAPQGSNTLRRVADAHLRAARPGHIGARWSVAVARRREHDRFYVCSRETYAAGFGLFGDSRDSECGDRTLDARPRT